MRGIRGKAIIITGAGGGLGEAYAQRLAGDGAMVVVADIDGRKARSVADAICKAGFKAISTETDVADPAAVASMVRAAIDRFGSVDALVNNAALYGPLDKKSLDDIERERWRKVFDVNVLGVVECTRAVHAPMKSRGGGRIVNVSSTTALVGTSGLADYATSKAAVLGLTRAFAVEYGPDNISVNAVVPGAVLTDATIKHRPQDPTLGEVARRQLIVRPLRPDDIAGLVAFLVSDEAPALTGRGIVIDGGALPGFI